MSGQNYSKEYKDANLNQTNSWQLNDYVCF